MDHLFHNRNYKYNTFNNILKWLVILIKFHLLKPINLTPTIFFSYYKTQKKEKE